MLQSAPPHLRHFMELMLDSIKVYEYILQDGDWVKGEEVKDGVRVEKVEETASTR